MPASLCCCVHYWQYIDSTQLGRQHRQCIRNRSLSMLACTVILAGRIAATEAFCDYRGLRQQWRAGSAFLLAVEFGVLHGLAPPCASSRLWRFIAVQTSSRRQKHLVCSHVVHWAVSASVNDGMKHFGHLSTTMLAQGTCLRTPDSWLRSEARRSQPLHNACCKSQLSI